MTTLTPAPADPQPAFDARAFRNALGSFPTGVAIITTTGPDGKPIGLTCNSFSSVSLEPPLVSWGLRLASKSLEAFRQAGAFAINVLAEDQKELSARFASGAVVDKFDGVTWTPGHRGLPVISGSVASFECDKFAEHLAGDHVLFLGHVARFDHGREEASLVFYKGAYMMLTQSLRELAAGGRLDSLHLDQARRLINCMLLRLACQNGSPEDFDAIERNIAQIENYADAAQRAEASIEFFRLVTKAAHNDVLVVVAETLTTLVRHVLQTDTTLRARPELVPVRRKILAHMRERDPDAAECEMSHYFDQLRREVAAQESTL
ncbi:flavin reductase [Variovorax sp. PBS-H4]|uniref:flavin reductase n=1 Tax=Variovorax sp. PBS-H4 TaxID=434008 RepID=UPI0018D7D1F2|nr:flavin reductase [Variovorax sp. PBS-H4]